MTEHQRGGSGAALADAARGSFAAMTAGQRWTTSLAIVFSVVVLAFGMPNPVRLVSPQTPAGASATTTVDTQVAAGPVEAPSGTPDEFTAAPVPARPARSPAAPVAASNPAAPAPVVGDATPQPTPPTARLAVLVEAGSGADLSRSDEAMARRYLDVAGVDATVSTIGEPAETCASASGSTVVAAIASLPPALTACLRSRGVAIVSWDDAAPAGAPDAVISTRRGVARSLLDTATALASELDGQTALVADETYRTVLEPVLRQPRVAALGIDEVVWIDGEPGPDVAVSIAGAATDNVLFATSTSRQSAIASQVRAFLPGVAFFTLDARDSVVEQRLTPALDGMRAVTSVQFPWLPDPDGVRAECREQWESAQTPPAVLGQGELLRALLWCQQIGLLAGLGPATPDAVGAFLASTVPSPVTSRLGPLADGGYGPSALTTATWSASCSCWGADEPFRGASR